MLSLKVLKVRHYFVKLRLYGIKGFSILAEISMPYIQDGDLAHTAPDDFENGSFTLKNATTYLSPF